MSDQSETSEQPVVAEQHDDWVNRVFGTDPRACADSAQDSGAETGNGDTAGPVSAEAGEDAAGAGPSSDEAVGPSAPDATETVQGGSESQLTTANGGIPFFIDPDVFDFRPTGPNWQQTSCVTIVFGYGSPFLPMMRIVVGVEVGAPMVLRDGKSLSVREAQLDSANAAEAAALIIKGMLDEGSIGTDEVQPRFTGFMGGAIMSTGLGYRVRGCRPTGG